MYSIPPGGFRHPYPALAMNASMSRWADWVQQHAHLPKGRHLISAASMTAITCLLLEMQKLKYLYCEAAIPTKIIHLSIHQQTYWEHRCAAVAGPQRGVRSESITDKFRFLNRVKALLAFSAPLLSFLSELKFCGQASVLSRSTKHTHTHTHQAEMKGLRID